MKQRFSSLDVKVTAHELSQALASLRLANIYDISSKKLLLKFAVSGKKEQLIVDSGFRTHLTEFTRPTAAAPSAFTSRLRKFLKTRRCTSVSQIGTDRIIELQFSDGAYRLYLEFFAAGNLVLTDADLRILAILRNVPEGDAQEPQSVGLTYTLKNRQNYGGAPPLTRDRLRNALQTTVEKAEAAEASRKKQKRKTGEELRRGLATTIEELPPVVVDHAFETTGFEPTAKPAEVLENEAMFDALFKSLEEARRIVDNVTGSAACKGYIVAKRRELKESDASDPTAQQGDKSQALVYEDFHPFLPRKFEKDDAYTILTFDNFNKTVDEFFSSIEGQKLESRLNDREAAAKRKLEAVREIQEKKVGGLQEVQMLNMRKAGAIEANIDRVQEAMDAVNGLIAQGMDWFNIGKLIEREQKRHNPVADIIKLPLNLEQNTMTLLLAEEEAEEELDEGYETTSDEDEENEDGDDEDTRKTHDTKLAIEVSLVMSPYANAREYYDQRKVAAVKQQKTVEQSATALKSAEKKIEADLKKGLKQEKPILQLMRRQMWFEKFTWFISSDGYLVLGGRDATQNEMLYKKHLRKGDVYVHADMHGAASVIVKNKPKTPDAPIPPSTLSQAGSLSVCSSSAWDSKAGMGAWWVNAEQVSKSSPTGEYLPSGSFMVRGNKNFLPPQPLILGFGFMFKISEESKANHVKHRLLEGVDEGLPSDGGVGGSIAKSEELGDAEDNVSETTEQAEQEATTAMWQGHDNPYEQGDMEDAGRQNPLQTEEEDGDDEHVDYDDDADHVKDALGKLSLGEAEEHIMSGALATDSVEEEPASAKNNVNDVNDVQDTERDAGQSGAGEDSTTASQTKGGKQKQAPHKRGQRSKQKKIAAKYKHQDEDDRAIHEELIGAAKGRQKAEAEAKARAERQAEEEARRERRKQAQQKQQQHVAEHEEKRRVMLDKGIEGLLDDGEDQSVAPLDALVGTPFQDDEILEAVPVCAPWPAMARCKYKAKIQPGATKKGKAVKEILERWKGEAGKKGTVDEQARDTERMWPREVELIKGVRPEEANNVVPVGKMTVMMAGGKGGKGGKGGGTQGKGKGGKGAKKR